MVLLPSHRPPKRKKTGATDVGVEGTPPKPSAYDATNKSNVTLQLLPVFNAYDNHKQDPTGNNQRPIDPYVGVTPGIKIQGGKSFQGEFDEYGAELGQEARVWKTYVKEADRFDAEKVEEWNKSLDVTLIFAALFSAISTAFVIESSKKLQEDPADSSAQALAVISQTLSTMVNNNQSLMAAPATPATGPFVPSRTDVCVNVLWFLSLSISVAVSLIAMLAKEWCYIFMSNRTGQPYSQAMRRQQRWDSMKHWKMPELLMFLPSLIHLALLLFAVGLCIYLWDMHFGVALPVLLVTITAIGVYAGSTILPLLDHLSPYSTAASRFIKSFRSALAKKAEENGTANSIPHQNGVTSEALRWLIEECEDPRSVDTALQAIAGADENLPLEPLISCHADKAIFQRMTAGSNYSSNYELVFKLYARAFAVLQSRNKTQIYEHGRYNDINELMRKIRKLQILTERTVANLLDTEELIPTQTNLLALRVGTTTASYFLESLDRGSYAQGLERFNSAVDLLEGYWNKRYSLHPAAIQSLVMGTAMLLSCSAVQYDASVVSDYLVRILTACPSPGDNIVGILLTAFSIARNNYPGWKHPTPLGHAARAERAIEVLIHYTPMVTELQRGPPGTLRNFGLLELLLNLKGYELVGNEIGVIYKIFAQQWINDEHILHTFPQSFDQREYVKNVISRKLTTTHEWDEIYASTNLVEAYLEALHFTCHLWIDSNSRNIASHVYVFVLESMCRAATDRILSTGSVLVAKLPFFKLHKPLATLIRQRNIALLLAGALEDRNNHKRTFATTELHKLVELILLTPHKPGGSCELLVTHLFRCEKLCNPLQRLQSLKEALEDELIRVSTVEPSREQLHSVNEIKIKLRELQAIKARTVSHWVVDEAFQPTSNNLLALGVGGQATSTCLRSLASGNHDHIFSTLSSTVKLLEQYGENSSLLHPAAAQSLIVGSAALLSCSAISSESISMAPFVLRILHAGLRDEYLGILLAAFALSRNDYPDVTPSALFGARERASRVIDLLARYTPVLEDSRIIPFRELKNLGLVELLFNATEYGLVEKDFIEIYTQFESVWENTRRISSTFPRNFNLGQCAMEVITRKMANIDTLDGIFASRASVVAHLDALRCTYNRSLGSPYPQVRVFVWESLCRASSLLEETIAEQLVMAFPPPEIFDHLAMLMEGRNLATLFANALQSNSIRVKIFATAQTCALLRLLLYAPHNLGQSWKSLIANLFGCEEQCDPIQRLNLVKETLTSRLEDMRSRFPHYSTNICPPEPKKPQGAKKASGAPDLGTDARALVIPPSSMVTKALYVNETRVVTSSPKSALTETE